MTLKLNRLATAATCAFATACAGQPQPTQNNASTRKYEGFLGEGKPRLRSVTGYQAHANITEV